MAFLLPRSVFIHIPKTGGTWVRHAIMNAGIPTSELSCDWHDDRVATSGPNIGQPLLPGHICFHNRFRDIDPAGRFTFAFVRHPVSYCLSHWLYKQRMGWNMEFDMDRILYAETVEGFLENVIEYGGDEGWVSRTYRMFLTDQDRRVDFIGAQEHLADDLVTALRTAGEAFDETAVRATMPYNVSDPHSSLGVSLRLIDRLMHAERNAMDQYGYDGYPIEHLVYA